MAVFVPGTAVGDMAEIKIVKVLKSYAFGIVERIVTPSPDRVENTCSVYKQCGGCLLRHISYEAECRTKDSIVRDAFTRIGGLTPEFDSFLALNETYVHLVELVHERVIEEIKSRDQIIYRAF